MDQFTAMLDQLDSATKLPRAQRLQKMALVSAIRAQAIQAIATRPNEASIWAIVAEAATSVELTGGFALPILPKAADVECPKCGGSGIFGWMTGEGECFDCRGTGFVTRAQANYRLANVPPVLIREQSGTTPFLGNPEMPLSSLVNTAPEIDDIPF